MIPYLEVPDLRLVPADALAPSWPEQDVMIRPFGTLVAISVLVGAWLSLRQAKRIGVSQTVLVGLLCWIVIGGFLGGHVLDVVFYHPALVFRDPSVLANLASGQSSFGGFIGATVGAWLWARVRRRRLVPFAEVVASSFPVAWVIGRLGCAAAHDHPGVRSNLWFAVAFPGGARLDLGAIEAFLVLPLAVVVLWLRRRPRPAGFFVGLMCAYYAPLRFTLDLFRARDLPGADARYAGLTPAQWGACLLFGVGLYFLTQKWRKAQDASTLERAKGSVSGGAEVLEREGQPVLTLAGTGKNGQSIRTT